MSTRGSRRLAFAYAVVVIAVSSLPSSRLPNLGGHGVDKLLHFLQYAVLGYLVARGWGPGRTAGNRPTGSWLPAAVLVLFAAVDEFHQHWIPGRSVDFWDWVADAAGVMASYALAVRINRRIQDLRSDPPSPMRPSTSE